DPLAQRLWDGGKFVLAVVALRRHVRAQFRFDASEAVEPQPLVQRFHLAQRFLLQLFKPDLVVAPRRNQITLGETGLIHLLIAPQDVALDVEAARRLELHRWMIFSRVRFGDWNTVNGLRWMWTKRASGNSSRRRRMRAVWGGDFSSSGRPYFHVSFFRN